MVSIKALGQECSRQIKCCCGCSNIDGAGVGVEGWLSKRKVGVLSAQMEMKASELKVHLADFYSPFGSLLSVCLEDIFPGPSPAHVPPWVPSLGNTWNFIFPWEAVSQRSGSQLEYKRHEDRHWGLFVLKTPCHLFTMNSMAYSLHTLSCLVMRNCLVTWEFLLKLQRFKELD